MEQVIIMTQRHQNNKSYDIFYNIIIILVVIFLSVHYVKNSIHFQQKNEVSYDIFKIFKKI